jgi:hypothetical protein
MVIDAPSSVRWRQVAAGRYSVRSRRIGIIGLLAYRSKAVRVVANYAPVTRGRGRRRSETMA